ncbi:hypothetical protein ABZ599_37455 [Streptomyces misionensis]|uniref:hypothetical protein n=1 Tax=Streptomyces misionensis TaxID=67331 RepID=UPI0034093576
MSGVEPPVGGVDAAVCPQPRVPEVVSRLLLEYFSIEYGIDSRSDSASNSGRYNSSTRSTRAASPRACVRALIAVVRLGVDDDLVGGIVEGAEHHLDGLP